MIYSVPKIWQGETCVILAGGPSLKGIDTYSYMKHNVKRITINDSWRLDAWAEVHYFCDAHWWQKQQAKNFRNMSGVLSFHDLIYKGFWITTAPGFEDHPQVRSLKLMGERGLEEDPAGLRHGSNSGYQAINLAVNLGAKKIVLLGYDMKIVNGRTHWHDNSDHTTEGFKTVLELSMLPHFESLVEPLKKLGVEVINATHDSALTCFPQMTLIEALEPPMGEF